MELVEAKFCKLNEDIIAIVNNPKTPHEATKEIIKLTFDYCAWICEAKVIGGRAWTTEQAIAADALFSASEDIRSFISGIEENE